MLATYVPRLAATWLRSLGAQPIDPLAEVRLPMRAWPVDVDVYLHVNNGRYLTLMDFGRFQHAMRTGLMGVMLRNRWQPILGSASMHYRREIRAFQRFDLVTALRAWDEKWFYIEQRFERDGEVHASGFVRGVMKQGRKTVPPADLLRAVGIDRPSPPPSPALAAWMDAERTPA